MSDFTGDLERFAAKAAQRAHDVFVQTTIDVQQSIVEGSPLTGAPGQPVDTGYLKNSWHPHFTSRTEWETTTNVGYAPVIEHNLRERYDYEGTRRPKELKSTIRVPGAPKGAKSTVGGHHSVALTVAGWERIVVHANTVVPP